MGILDVFTGGKKAAPEINTFDVAASLAPVNTTNQLFNFFGAGITATRAEAMSIPTIARARGIITSSVSAIELVVRDKNTELEVDAPRVINQPDPRIPGSAFYSWLAEDLLFYGYGYARVTDLYQDTFRVRSMERISPERVTVETNSLGTEIEYYRVDNYAVPLQGVGSLVVYYGNDEGLLRRAGRTLRAGAELERAAAMYAAEPVPTMVLKSNGTSLPADRIAKLLESWGSARRNRGTAFLNADVTLETLGFDPEKLQLNQARSYVSVELARAIGIPAYYVDAESGSSMTYSNASTARQSLVDFSLLPMMKSIESRLSMSDFVPVSQEVKFNLDEYLRGSALERAQIYDIYNRLGVLSADEIRRMEDMIRE